MGVCCWCFGRAFVAGVSVRLAVHFLERLVFFTQISVIDLAMAAFSAGVPQLLVALAAHQFAISLALSHRRSLHGQILSLDRLCSFL